MRLRPCCSISLILLLCGPLVFAQKVRQDYDRSIDFGKFKTFVWMEGSGALTRQELDERIRIEVAAELASRGITQAEEGAVPDLQLIYVTYTRPEDDSNEYDDEDSGAPAPYGHWRTSGDTLPSNWLRTRGSFVLDMIDPQTRKMVWRGSAEKVIKDQPPRDLNKEVKKWVGKMFKKFPRKKEKKR